MPTVSALSEPQSTTAIRYREFLWIAAAVLLCGLEGAARKWLVAGGTVGKVSAYFSKDFAFAMVLFGTVRIGNSWIVQECRNLFGRGVVLVLAGATISAFVGINAAGAAMTLRALVFLPLVAASVMKRMDVRHLRLCSSLFGILTIVNFFLSYIQTQLPSTHILNRYAEETDFIVELEAGVRACGTFAYISGLATLAVVGVWAGLVILSMAENKGGRYFGAGCIFAGLGCSLTTFSRAPLVVGVLMILWWSLFSGAGLLFFARLVGGVVVVGTALWLLGVAGAVEHLWLGLLDRHQSAGETVQGRGFGQIGEALNAAATVPFGNGFGTEQVVANYYSSGSASFTHFETQLPRLILDVGLIGTLGFIVIHGGLLLVLQRAKMMTGDRKMRAVIVATQVLVGGISYLNIVYNHTASSMVWIIVAVTVGAYAAAAQAAEKAQ